MSTAPRPKMIRFSNMVYSPLSIQNAIMATRAVMITPNRDKNVAGPFVKIVATTKPPNMSLAISYKNLESSDVCLPYCYFTRNSIRKQEPGNCKGSQIFHVDILNWTREAKNVRRLRKEKIIDNCILWSIILKSILLWNITSPYEPFEPTVSPSFAWPIH